MEDALPPAPGIQEYKLSNGWWSIWYDATRLDLHPHYNGQNFNKFVRPEFDLKEETDLPPHEQKGGSDPLIRNGNWTFKPFKRSGAWRAELLRRDVLESGRYRFTAWVRPDPVGADGAQGKVYATDRAAFVYAVYDDAEGELIDLTPTDAHTVNWHAIVFEFDGDGPQVYGLGFYCPFALKNSGFFCDGWTLEKLPDPEPPPSTECEARARVPYDQTIHVYDPAQGREAYLDVAAAVWDEYGPQHLGPSSDAPFVGCGLGSKKGVWHHVTANEWPGYLDFAKLYYPKVEIEMERRPWGDTPPPPPPPPPLHPHHPSH
jgi:hypothetical protein